MCITSNVSELQPNQIVRTTTSENWELFHWSSVTFLLNFVQNFSRIFIFNCCVYCK
uniref:Uncharacterized protein n=1 Tax=Anguilla anguilla TaxID=7936 RepID=A0A0E9XMR4_ANGAN